MFGLFDKKPDPYFGLSENEDETKKMLSQRQEVLAGLQQLNAALGTRSMDMSRDKMLVDRLLKEGSGR